MTACELRKLPAAVDIETAARAFGLGRTTAYALARTDSFPCQLIRAGKAYRVITADLLRVLHITPENTEGVEVAPSTPSSERISENA